MTLAVTARRACVSRWTFLLIATVNASVNQVSRTWNDVNRNNVSTVLAMNTTYGPRWLEPTETSMHAW
jgi:hypothetical protein